MQLVVQVNPGEMAVHWADEGGSLMMDGTFARILNGKVQAESPVCMKSQETLRS